MFARSLSNGIVYGEFEITDYNQSTTTESKNVTQTTMYSSFLSILLRLVM